MTFGLPSWLKSRYKDLAYEVPVWYPTHDQPDHREWLITNGLGGYSSSTICGANTRRYHGILISNVGHQKERNLILSRVDELVTIRGTTFELSTNHWESGVVSPTGYRLIESFTNLPAPTWVFNLDGHYLIKQLVMPHNTNEVHLGYFWLPDNDIPEVDAFITIHFLTAFRNFHDEVRGSADKHYQQITSQHQTVITLNGSGSTLNLNWSSGSYEPQEQWWWSYHWPEEAARGLPDQEDLYLLGSLKAQLSTTNPLSISTSLGQPQLATQIEQAVQSCLTRQNKLLARAALPRTPENNQLVLACDQLIIKQESNQSSSLNIIAGYPWFDVLGRDALIATAGLTLAGRLHDEAKQILTTYSHLLQGGLLPQLFLSPSPSYRAADNTLWWALALYHYFRATRDIEFIREQYPLLREAARQYTEGTAYGIKVDTQDGLLRCGDGLSELTWMNAQVADIPITPRSGKPVEVCALWYNLLETLRLFASQLGEDIGPFANLAILSHTSMQKFWNNEAQCLFDVLEPDNEPSEKPISSIRPNQIFAVSLPFRALTKLQEKSVLAVIESQLLTPLGLRSLSPTDPSYQGRYGCGFSRADQYHRDLSYHQGTVWPWLMGAYCDALLNVHGSTPETKAKIRILLEPLLNHLTDEDCVGSISEIFDGASPHTAHGCIAHAISVAETMRMLSFVLKS